MFTNQTTVNMEVVKKLAGYIRQFECRLNLYLNVLFKKKMATKCNILTTAMQAIKRS